MHRKPLFFDFETIPAHDYNDSPFAKKWLNNLYRKKPVDEVTLRSRQCFDVDFAKICAMGVAVGEDAEPVIMTLEDYTEKEIVKAFWDYFSKSARLVSFRGRTYDFPLVLRRTLLLGMQAISPEYAQDYLKRFTFDPHLDFHDYFTNFDYNTKHSTKSLEFYGELLGVDVEKHGGGEDIYPWVMEGKWKDVSKHVEIDVVYLQQIYRRVFNTNEKLF